MKYLGVNVIEHEQDLCAESYKLMKEYHQEDLKWEYILC